MEGNDIGTYVTHRNVVILEDLMFEAPAKREISLFGKQWGRKDVLAAQWKLNEGMVSWITWNGRNGLATEVWSFLPEWLYDKLVERLQRIEDDYITAYRRFDTQREAWLHLRNDPTILAVYDADIDRIQLDWQMRGKLVPKGMTP